ncbi:MAG TPA: hypothetical protein PKH10_08460, partial [bacterium]|nr:hypothetical protein [bacterium]
KFISLIEDHLLFAPELKLENQISTIISVFLNRKGIRAEREVSDRDIKRCDLVIEEKTIEAKYHFEGDLIEVKNEVIGRIDQIRTGDFDKEEKKRPGAGIEVVHDMMRKDRDYFLWYLCVRKNESSEEGRYRYKGKKYRYKYPKGTEIFYQTTSCQYEQSSKVVLENIREMNECLETIGIISYQLPPIETEKATLWTFLYKLK